MHELGIAQDFWKTITDNASKNGLKRITKITIALGETSGIEEEFLRHSLVDHILPGTIAAGAELEVTSIPLSARCRSCGIPITANDMLALCCPSCGGTDIEITSGREAHVQSIEGE